MHERGVIHSDIKAVGRAASSFSTIADPLKDNILISSQGEAVIGDFGCARMSHYSLPVAKVSSTSKGTTAFCAPESLASGVYSKQTDVWAFGMTVYVRLSNRLSVSLVVVTHIIIKEMLTRQRPFQGCRPANIMYDILHGKTPEFPPPSGTVTDEQQLLQDICRSCWSRVPTSRPTMQEVCHGLETNKMPPGPGGAQDELNSLYATFMQNGVSPLSLQPNEQLLIHDQSNRQQTSNHSSHDPHSVSDSIGTTKSNASSLKRRRDYRTEKERLAYFLADPYVAEVQPHRVLCNSCEKWIRLRKNSTYCNTPWDIHRRACLERRA